MCISAQCAHSIVKSAVDHSWELQSFSLKACKTDSSEEPSYATILPRYITKGDAFGRLRKGTQLYKVNFFSYISLCKVEAEDS